MKTLNIGLIGYGFMGRAHSNAFRKVSNFFDLEYRLVFEVEEVAHLAESIRVRAAHEAVADESDIEGFHGDLWLVSIRSVSADAVFPLSSSGGEGWGEEAVSR